MNNPTRSLTIVCILTVLSFAHSISAEAPHFIYDFSSRAIRGEDISDIALPNLGAFDYSIRGSGGAGSLNVSQRSYLDLTVISGTFTSQVHSVMENCESIQQNDLWVSFRVTEDIPFRFSVTNSYRLQRTGNPLEEYCEGPLVYLFGTSNGTPYIQSFVDFPFDSTGTMAVSNIFDITGVFRSNATHTLCISLPVGARLGSSGTGAADIIRTLKFTLALILPPSLSVNRSASGITMNWPASGTNYVLESTSSSAPTAGWSGVTNSVATVNGTNSVHIGIAGTNRFFRLRKTGF